MKITKYEHACFTVEKDDQILVVDPGEFTTDFIAPENVVAIVITHEHGDHYDHQQLEAIIDKNPEAIIFAPQAVTARIEVFQTQTVHPGETIAVGPFSLAFTGGEHAVIYPEYPPTENVGVMINDLLYYPGDSLTLPKKPVDTLALPAAAPWLKISEAMDFLLAVHPRLAFPTHDAILSIPGKEVADYHLGYAAEKGGISYQRVQNPIVI